MVLKLNLLLQKKQKKKFFLYKKKPKIAEAYFLKHKTLKMVDIELISHGHFRSEI